MRDSPPAAQSPYQLDLRVDLPVFGLALAGTALIEAMKTEIAVQAGVSGRVRDVRAAPGAAVVPGQVLAVIDPG